MKHNWDYKKLGDVASFRRGLTYAKDDVVNHSSKIVLRSNNINLETSSLNFDDVVCLRDDFVIPLDKLLRGGDIFICMSNGSTQHLGKVAHVQETLNMAFGGFMGVIEPNENLTNSRYVFYCCRSGAYRSYLNSIFNGANINNLKWSDLSKFVVPIPPLSVQSRIVAELDLLTGIIDKQNAQLKELDNLAQAIFYDMFGAPIENPKGWGVKMLGDEVNIVGGYAFKSNCFVSVGIPVLRIGNINSGKVKTDQIVFYNEDDKLAKYMVYPNDLVISLTGTAGKEDYGNICKLDSSYPRYYLNQRNAKLELGNRLKSCYVQYLFKDKSIKGTLTAVNRGVRQGNISNKDIENLIVPIPPLTLQQSFAEKIQSIEKQKETIRASIADTQKLLDYTMDKYFG